MPGRLVAARSRERAGSRAIWRGPIGMRKRSPISTRPKAMSCCVPKRESTRSSRVAAAVAALRGRGECTGKVGALGFGRGGRARLSRRGRGRGRLLRSSITAPGSRRRSISRRASVARSSCTSPRTIRRSPAEAVARIKAAFDGRPEIAIYVYPGVARGFERPLARITTSRPRGLAHSRSIALLRQRDGAALRPRSAVGQAHALRIRHRATSPRRCGRWCPSPMSTTSRR